MVFAGRVVGSEDMKEAAVGAAPTNPPSAKSAAGQGFEPETIAAFLRRNADLLHTAKLPHTAGISCTQSPRTPLHSAQTRARYREYKGSVKAGGLGAPSHVLEEKLFAALLAATPDEEIVTVRAQADRELSPYRRKMSAPQIEQLQKQYVHKRLLEKYNLPRLSLFYM